jgi:hypothetical protein
LNFLEKEWQYEPKTFVFSDGTTYTPDFYCEETFYELKGRMTQNCENKLSKLKEEYPNIQLELIDGESYSKLRIGYKNLIPLWEGK